MFDFYPLFIHCINTQRGYHTLKKKKNRFSVLKNQGNHKKMDSIQEQQKRTDKVTIRDDYCLWWSVLCFYYEFLRILLIIIIIIIIIIIFINCNCVVTRWQWLFYMYTNMKKKVTRKFKSGGLHEKHVVATWKLGNHFGIRL